MKEIQRYTEGGYGVSEIEPDAMGDYVTYEDHAAIVAELQEQVQKLAAENAEQASSLKGLAALNNRLWKWTSRMSYNASYVGEPEGMVKGHIREMEKILDAAKLRTGDVS